ncbi:protocatechuate 3,4-dioxygenase subunit alpha [Agromyces archimandritae]|uniref:Protocatechuate 3,4-dioxygenase subunit alpha n=1 Tax=Agromyces archimandritae TaxID=2781962 RepID=A0A975FMQ2_9MICO|nr:protocatechuate 3,4-dioxygenase subunit alpha [Agromyces archimandritae]QTX03841.1 protocatechuate 3,4-dioxygenase subunit alpha [Agromyces archimandritae]
MPEQLLPTPGQTVGPFFAFGLDYPASHELVHPHSPGAIVLSGTVFDGAGMPVPDAVVEIWQPDADGRIPTARGSLKRDGHTFTGFGRSLTSDDGHYEFWTVAPGAVDAGKAPYLLVALFARGLLDRLFTRIYLPGDDAALAADPLLSSLTADERATLVARRTPAGHLEHDLHLQGAKETVFLEF